MFAGTQLISFEIKAGTKVQAIVPAAQGDLIGIESSPKNSSDINLKLIAKIGVENEKDKIHREPDYWHFKGAGAR
ncbi:MAG: hypothetical protein P4L51_27475 [Puia sp.]|nr:hypothetical protein [Puia sp.]